jgi:hypothetical protein
MNSAIDFLDHDPDLANQYVARRAAEAAQLLTEFVWKPHLTGTLRAYVYGHSIVWDITGKTLHAYHTEYEFLPLLEDEPVCCTLQQVLAYILARNW